MKVSAKNKICMIIGDPVEHSLSPAMHNAGYEALGIDDELIFVAAHVKVENIETVVEGMRAMNIHGLTCTIPHKIEVIKYLDKVDPIAAKIGAVNTVLNQNGKLVGYNTDWLGVIIPIAKTMNKDIGSKFLTGKKAATLGAGGAARAMAYALQSEGAEVKVFNRDLDGAKELAEDFGIEYATLDDVSEVKNFDIVLNSTPLGMGELVDQSPLPIELINSNQIIFDAVYSPYETKLLNNAKAKGAKLIHGCEMLIYQGVEQFRIYTGHQAPAEVMAGIVYKSLGL